MVVATRESELYKNDPRCDDMEDDKMRKTLLGRHIRSGGGDVPHQCKICLSNIIVVRGGSCNLAQCPHCQDVLHVRCFEQYLKRRLDTEDDFVPSCINCKHPMCDEDEENDDYATIPPEWDFDVDVFDSDDEDFEGSSVAEDAWSVPLQVARHGSRNSPYRMTRSAGVSDPRVDRTNARGSRYALRSS